MGNQTDPAPQLTLVIPAFNEARRLGPYLDSAIAYLEAELQGRWEIVIVDDGSVDGTAGVATRRHGPDPRVRLVRHGSNLGKGAAVQTGVAASKGQIVLFADADGATPIAEERRLRRVIEAGADVAIGSREVLSVVGAPATVTGVDEPVQRDVHLHRYVIGRTFAFMVNTLLGLSYADTQCGFKMFRRDVADVLFGEMTQRGYAFDVELLYLAARRSCRVAEVPVNWHDVPGSKVRLVRDSWQMLRALVQIRFARRSAVRATTTSPPASAAVAVGVKTTK